MKNSFSVLFLINFIGFLFYSIVAQSQFIDSQKGYISKSITNSLKEKNVPVNSKIKDLSNPLILSVIKQDTTLLYQIITWDGNEYIGNIVEFNGPKISLRTQNLGLITINKADIKRMTLIKLSKVKDGLYWQDHMQSTRYFWSPNGYGLKKGEAYYQNVWIFFNQVSVGITDNILIGGGLIPFFLFGGAPSPIWITPKVSFPVIKDKVNIGVGGLFATILQRGEKSMNFGITYGTVTLGPRNKNVTLGAGWGYADGSWATRPTISVSFISRLGRKGYFISENYLVDIGGEYFFLGMIGGRSMLGSGNIGLDYGLVIPISTEIGSFVAIPWLGITVPLGKRDQINLPE